MHLRYCCVANGCMCVPLCCGGDGIYNLDDAMQGRVRPDGHVGATEVIVNGAHHANDVQMGGTLGLVGCDLTWSQGEITACSDTIFISVAFI